MKTFFEPSSAALIGASSRPGRPGHHLFQNMRAGLGENLYPVNPTVDEIDGVRCYRSLLDVPVSPDLAVVFIPAAGVPEVLEQCATKGVRRVIIESAGFAETGPVGVALQQRCLEIARAADMRLWGPNCMGAINVHRGMVLSFMLPDIWKDRFIKGPVALVVQSGMLSAGFLMQILSRSPFGLSKVCSVGNKMDIDEVDILEYLVDDPDTGVIAMYLESLPRGRRFVELARATAKPLVALKGGRSRQGAQAAASHTASLAQDDAVLDSAFRQAGVIRVEGMYQLMDVARCLSMGVSRPALAARVAVITFSGGAGVVCADDLAARGLRLASLTPDSLARLRTVFPEWMDPMNPVDLYPAIEKSGPAAFAVAIDAVTKDPGVDAVFLHLFAPPSRSMNFDYDGFARLVKSGGKPFLVWVLGYGPSCIELSRELEKRGVPTVDEIEKGARILAAMTRERT